MITERDIYYARCIYSSAALRVRTFCIAHICILLHPLSRRRRRLLPRTTLTSTSLVDARQSERFIDRVWLESSSRDAFIMVSLRVASLFSGIGGLDLGLLRAGHRVVLMVERDDHCKQILKSRFPGVPLLSDVAEVLPFMIENCDLIAAGFPCNDCSHENLRRPGLENGVATRNVSHVFRLLESVRVPWVLLENVVGLLTWNQQGTSRPAIDYVVTELENLGYRWAYRVVDLVSFGVPHRRRRVFIVGSLHGDPRDVMLSQTALCQGQCISLGEHRECYECFLTPPRMATEMFSASIDLGEKRRPPLTDILHCLTTTNGRR